MIFCMKNLENHNVFRIILEELNNGKETYFSVHGNSMYPTIKDGENVKIIKYQNIKIGDIIAYYLENNSECKIIVHRVIFLRTKYVLTKGDNNKYIDPLRVPYENILGKVELMDKSI